MHLLDLKPMMSVKDYENVENYVNQVKIRLIEQFFDITEEELLDHEDLILRIALMSEEERTKLAQDYLEQIEALDKEIGAIEND